jgi:hypothetical protein
MAPGGPVRFANRVALVLIDIALFIAVGGAVLRAESPAACPAQDEIQSVASVEAATPAPEAPAERLQLWRAERARIISSLFEVGHADGSVSIDPQNLLSTEIVMRRNADGSISIRCLSSGWRSLPAPPPSPALETK